MKPMIFENNIPKDVIAQAKAVVVTFVQPGCPACHDHLPKFKAVASLYAHCIPVFIIDVSKQNFDGLSNYYQVRQTPTTIVLARGRHPAVAVGALNEQDLLNVFNMAVAGLSCAL